MAGKEKMLALGMYPETSLKEARAHRDDARKLIANGSDPGEVRKAEKITVTEERRQQFEAEAIERMTQVLRELEPLTGGGRYVFPGARSGTRPMSNNNVNAALKRLGIDTQTELTGHGFRAMARTIIEEGHGFRPEIIELQLAHAVRDPLGRAYNRTKHLAERKRMMQVWADYLDELRDSKNV